MSKDGAGNTHNLATWLFWSEKSASETDHDQRQVQRRQKLEAAMAEYPHLREKAAKLVRQGVTDPQLILHHFRLANKQFTFRHGTKKGQP